MTRHDDISWLLSLKGFVQLSQVVLGHLGTAPKTMLFSAVSVRFSSKEKALGDCQEMQRMLKLY